MRLLCPAIRPYAAPGVLHFPSTDIYATLAMVSFFVSRLEHYRDWAWYTSDLRPKVGIGGLITPLLQFMNVPLGKDTAGPRFIDGTYLRIATYFSGMYGKNYVYHYNLKGKPVEVVLPNKNLTSLERPGAISFNISQEDFLGEHGSLDPIAAPRKRSAPTRHDEHTAEASEPVYGPPRYYFQPYAGVLPPGALRDAHEHIGRLQRWNKAQDRTIEKLKDKCKVLSKTVKKQAKNSAKFMKKVADVLTRGGIAGCSSADFAFASTSVPQPPPQPANLGFPLTARQLQRKWRNPPIDPPPQETSYSSATGGYYTTFPPDDDGAGASTPTHYPAGKSVAVPTNEESDGESEDEQAPTKKAKMSKGKATPTRFADLGLLKELGLDSDIEAMLEHLKLPKLLTMAYPFYKEVSCQFLSSLEVTYHNTPHVRQGLGKIKFKVNGRDYNMNFKDIGRAMGFQDLEDSSLPKCENLPTELWKLITGNRHSTGSNKNSHIRHPSVRYLHRMLVHALYPWKEAGNVTEEDMRLLCPAIRPYAAPGVLPFPSTDIYATFGMVSFFVSRLEHYRDWAWYTSDLRPKVGIGGLITPLLQFMNVPLGKDASGPRFIDGTYLRIATYFSGMYGKNYVYHYYLKGKPVEVVLPNKNLTSLERPGAISFNISQEDFLGEYGSLDPIAAPRKRIAPTRHDDPAAEAYEPVYGPPRYYFQPYAGVLPPGALRDAHEHIGRLQ
ncbi:hypothetical protein F2Q69_00053676 [Brassica cretica]|uniref:Arabidopsis retrotransposon Orf1 C-terminal domain-containing protein n=1 Tax=Brassica cretica TaxID=69181 RepID=A0A8S9MVS7_BRACR|nr:hypothetical protein F2Q69_00053676 [Brassica cretica]